MVRKFYKIINFNYFTHIVIFTVCILTSIFQLLVYTYTKKIVDKFIELNDIYYYGVKIFVCLLFAFLVMSTLKKFLFSVIAIKLEYKILSKYILNIKNLKEEELNNSIVIMDRISKFTDFLDNNLNSLIYTPFSFIFTFLGIFLIDRMTAIIIIPVVITTVFIDFLLTDKLIYSSQKYYKENFALKTPSFIHQGEEKVGFNSAEKGTIFHLAMQLLDFSKFDTEDISKIREEIKLQINSFVEKNIMSLDEIETININWIVKFIQSDIFKEIYIANKSEKLFKEKAIDYNIKLKNLFKDENIEEDEKIMVVGIIDLFFENENGEIILLDYKTDYVTKENLEEVKARYKVQLDLYKSAIEDISGKKVAKKGLYLFGINEFVEI